MSRRHKIASDQLKLAAAESVGFAGKVRQSGWESATTQEIGLMVGEMIKRGQMELLKREGLISDPYKH